MEKFSLKIDEVEIECNPESAIEIKNPVFFRVNQSKLDDQVKLSNQLILASKRYFSDKDILEMTIGYNGTDFVDNKITIGLRVKSNFNTL